ncbi:MAG TPA: hypothetical protein VFC63_10420 [Blastocatellia bacterium]|nr:hypothetical protein [Blastocatellia bacterium]
MARKSNRSGKVKISNLSHQAENLSETEQKQIKGRGLGLPEQSKQGSTQTNVLSTTTTSQNGVSNAVMPMADVE